MEHGKRIRRGAPAWGILLLGVAGQAADVTRAPQDRETVGVTLSVLATPREAATRTMVSMGPIDLTVGQAMVQSNLVPSFSFGVAGDPDGCGAGLATEPVEATLARYPIAWTADVRLDEVSTDRLVLSGRWGRFARGADASPVRTAGATIPTLSLREDERVLLDLVEPATAGNGECMRNFVLELTARVTEDPALASRQIAYELWLVHESDGARKTATRSELTASQGEQVSFAFPKVTLMSETGRGSGDETLDVTVTGRVRGRVRADGSLTLSLLTARSLSYVAPDGGSDGGISESGEKSLEVGSGEAVRVELPDPGRGVARNDPRASRMSADLAGHSFAIVVRARPLS